MTVVLGLAAGVERSPLVRGTSVGILALYAVYTVGIGLLPWPGA